MADTQLSQQDINVLKAFAQSIATAATIAQKDPVEFAASYGAGGATLVIARGLEAEAKRKRETAQAAMQQAETEAQALESRSRAVQAALVTQTQAA